MCVHACVQVHVLSTHELSHSVFCVWGPEHKSPCGGHFPFEPQHQFFKF